MTAPRYEVHGGAHIAAVYDRESTDPDTSRFNGRTDEARAVAAALNRLERQRTRTPATAADVQQLYGLSLDKLANADTAAAAIEFLTNIMRALWAEDGEEAQLECERAMQHFGLVELCPDPRCGWQWLKGMEPEECNNCGRALHTPAHEPMAAEAHELGIDPREGESREAA